MSNIDACARREGVAVEQKALHAVARLGGNFGLGGQLRVFVGGAGDEPHCLKRRAVICRGGEIIFPAGIDRAEYFTDIAALRKLAQAAFFGSVRARRDGVVRGVDFYIVEQKPRSHGGGIADEQKLPLGVDSRRQ